MVGLNSHFHFVIITLIIKTATYWQKLLVLMNYLFCLLSVLHVLPMLINLLLGKKNLQSLVTGLFLLQLCKCKRKLAPGDSIQCLTGRANIRISSSQVISLGFPSWKGNKLTYVEDRNYDMKHFILKIVNPSLVEEVSVHSDRIKPRHREVEDGSQEEEGKESWHYFRFWFWPICSQIPVMSMILPCVSSPRSLMLPVLIIS